MTQVLETKNIVKEIEQLKTKIRFLGSLRRFVAVAKKGRIFAKKNKIRPQDVLKDD